MKTTFTTTVVQAEGKQATGLRVPAEAVSALGSHKRPKVVVQLNDYTYRSTVAAYGDVFMLPLSAEHARQPDSRPATQLRLRWSWMSSRALWRSRRT